MSSYTYGIEFFRTLLPSFLGLWGLLKSGDTSTKQRIINVLGLTDVQLQLAIALAQMIHKDQTYGLLKHAHAQRAIGNIHSFLGKYDAILKKGGRASPLKHAIDMYLAWLRYHDAYVWPNRASAFQLARSRYFLVMNDDGERKLIHIRLPSGKPIKEGHDTWHWETNPSNGEAVSVTDWAVLDPTVFGEYTPQLKQEGIIAIPSQREPIDFERGPFKSGLFSSGSPEPRGLQTILDNAMERIAGQKASQKHLYVNPTEGRLMMIHILGAPPLMN